MITDAEIKLKGLEILAKHLGYVNAERFISLIQKEAFDYTKWCQRLDEESKQGGHTGPPLRMNGRIVGADLCVRPAGWLNRYEKNFLKK
jgi:hypothetical protein